jgi:hypothetical protein
MFDYEFPIVKAVLVGVQRGDMRQIDLDISSKSSQITQYLGGSATFIGQWPELDIVIMKCRDCIVEYGFNENKLVSPFHRESVVGPILMIRMNEKSEPVDLTLQEVLESKLVLPRRPLRNAVRATCESLGNP